MTAKSEPKKISLTQCAPTIIRGALSTTTRAELSQATRRRAKRHITSEQVISTMP